MNQEFTIREDGFKEIKKQMIIRLIYFGILVLGISFLLIYYSSNRDSLVAFIFIFSILIAYLVIRLNKTINNQKAIYDSFKLTISQHEIVREQKNTPSISIPLNEVKSVTKYKNGNLVIAGNAKNDAITVPAQINNPEELEQILSGIQTNPDVKVNSIPKIIRIVSLITTVVCMGIVYFYKDKLIVAIAGSLCILLFSYSLFEVYTNKSIDSENKKRMLWGVVVLISIIGNMYFKLTGKG